MFVCVCMQALPAGCSCLISIIDPVSLPTPLLYQDKNTLLVEYLTSDIDLQHTHAYMQAPRNYHRVWI